ncbi:polymorphic toxin-type HINT domain-containing protein [Streptomyces sp. CB03911]|uniref:polymorphic toxin-type HINT domain-containing protein n=1 Tax=Streptomyces sp. CB03911 TaxID=1804758 RepID=UPI00093CA0C0|nr:polymorphic toxin-type HINT domain-containing protein [Streptomyces sp. CB03911]OKI25143.1 hypothetical protein A6A07_31630 [Streptomyces sp. CB03911]
MVPLALVAGLLTAAPVMAEEPLSSGLGATDRGKIVEFWKAGGPALRAAAETALIGSDQDVHQFLDTGRATAENVDDREAALQIVAQAGPGLREAAQQALASTPQALDTFLKDGWKQPLQQDELVEATRITQHADPGVKEAGNAAMLGSIEDVEAFLSTVQYEQRDTDDLVRATQIESAGGPAVKLAASLAMKGSIEDVRQFLTVGQYTARADDQEYATITQLADQVTAAGQQAEQEAIAAQNASNQAVAAARLAKEAGAVAAAETKAAQNDATRATEASRRATEASRRAADAARASVGAARAANAAARFAAAAAADASSAATNAAQATAKALNAANATTRDEEAIKGALFAAALSSTTAQAADKAANAARSVAQMQPAANNIQTDLNAAIDSANESAGYATQAGVSSAATTAAAGATRRYAQESSRATKAALALAGEAGDAAASARDAANSAAARATAAADAASKAGSHAGDAAQATEQARIHSEAATAASDAANTAVDKAKTVYDLARRTEAEDITARTNAGRNQAEDLTAETIAAQAEEAKAQSDLKKLDEDFTALAAQAGQPGADAQLVVTSGRKMAITAMKISGPWARSAAEYALAGTDDAMLEYARVGWQTARQQDEKIQAFDLIASTPYEAVATAATEALNGDATALHTFLESGQHQAALTDYLVDVTRISQHGGPGLKEAGDAAVNAGTPQALVDFLTVTQYQARETDDRVAATRLAQHGGPEMKVAAEAAIASPASALHAFIERGQYQAELQDQLAALHLAQVQQAISEATDVAARARQNASLAAQAYAIARNANTEATNYAQQAQNDANQAAAAASQAQISAQQAKQSANNAAQSAKTAAAARQRAFNSVDSAQSSATWARLRSEAANTSANDAYAAANTARDTAVRAGKTANEIIDTYNAALDQQKKEREEYERYQQSQEFIAKWNQYTYNNLPPLYKAAVAFGSLSVRQKMEIAVELVHFELDIIGSLPVVGIPVNLANCGMYFTEGQMTGDSGKYKDAALSCASAVPIGGWAALSVKLEKWGAKTEKLREAAQKLWKNIDDFLPCVGDSFPAGTRVLMGDGATRPIEDLRVGDDVQATDPETGIAGPRPIEATIYTPDDRGFTQITVTDAKGEVDSVTATDHHPFWSENRHKWTDASLLTEGDALRAPSGEAVRISDVQHQQIVQPAFNLTVQGLHTYYVMAGAVPVLVHNCSDLARAQKFRRGLAHTLDEHVVSPNKAKDLAAQKGKPNSVWKDAALAQEVANYAVKEKSKEIQTWLRGSESTRTMSGTYGTRDNSLGTVYYQSGDPTPAGNKWIMQICRDPEFKGGFYIRTIFPG